MTEQLILAMPPEWRASRQLRLHRKLRRVALTAGPFNVTGNTSFRGQGRTCWPTGRASCR